MECLASENSKPPMLKSYSKGWMMTHGEMLWNIMSYVGGLPQ